ncbi:MAG TPA: calcium-binding protein [Coleofasciculaceae cyanobacterium]
MTDTMNLQDAPDGMNLPGQNGGNQRPPAGAMGQPPADDNGDGIEPKPPRAGKGEKHKHGHRQPGMGGEGNDTLMSSKNNMILNGGAGDDKLIGGKGKDLLVGGDGNDILFGHRGPNIMVGGTGSDIFVLNRGRGHNIVKDFNALEGDKLALPRGLTFDKLTITQIGNDTLIEREHHKVGLLLGVQASSITADVFIKPPSLTAPSPLTAPSSPTTSSPLPTA